MMTQIGVADASTQTIVAEYDPNWPEEFEALSRLLIAALGHLAVAIHHMGSTSIPGMPAKPILDLDVEIDSNIALSDVIEALGRLGYQYEGEKGIVDRHAFRRVTGSVPFCEPEQGWMEHHLYVCPADSRELQRHLLFRDRLRAEPELRVRYAAIKAEALALASGSRGKYVEEKARLGQTFFDEVLGGSEVLPSPQAERGGG